MSATARSSTSSTPSSFSIIYEAVPEPCDPSSATPRPSSSSCRSGRSTFDLCSELENGNREAAEEIPASCTSPSTPADSSPPLFSTFVVPEWIRKSICAIGVGLALLAFVVLLITLMAVVGSWIATLVNGILGFLRTLGILPNMSRETTEAASTVAEAVALTTEAAVTG